MRQSLLILILVIGCVVNNCEGVYAQYGGETVTKEEEKAEVPKIWCPKTLFTDNSKCMDCHVLKQGKNGVEFGIKEINPHDSYSYPGYKDFYFKFGQDGTKTAYLLLSDVSSAKIEAVFKYLSWHPDVKNICIELHNPGGPMFDMWRIIGLMDDFKMRGGVIETQCNGFAASAGFIIFVNGTKGKRLVNRNAMLMWHEIMSFKMFSLETPSSSEDEAKILRMFQDNGNSWLADRSNLSKEQIDDKVRKLQFWMTGTHAVDFGFADGFITEGE